MISKVIRRRPSTKKPSCVRDTIGQIGGTATMNSMADPARPMDSVFKGNPFGRHVAKPLLDPNGDPERPWVIRP